MEGGHGFFDGDGGVEAVDLEEVDVGGLETGEGVFDVGEDGLAGETLGVLDVDVGDGGGAGGYQSG